MEKYFIIALCLLLCAGCKEDEEFLYSDKSVKEVKVTAPQLLQNQLKSRAHVEENGQVFWDKEDMIGVFSDTEQSPQRFTYKEEENGTQIFSTTGTGVKGNKFYAYSPYDSFEKSEGTLFTYKLPSEQQENDYINKLPMVAQSKSEKLSFMQTCGLIRLRITSKNSPLGNIGSITLSGNNNEFLSGTGSIDIASDNPVFTLKENKEKSIKLTGELKPDASGKIKDIYFIIPPQNFTKGITVTMTFDDSNSNIGYTDVRKKTEKPISVTRGSIISFTTIDVDETLEEEKTTEREALIALYDATNGDNWTNNTNWCTDAPLEEWHGVSLSDGEHVGHLNLSLNNLTGTIPEALLNLQNLQQISFDTNNLEGEFPTFLCKLPRLHTLSLYNNKLTGTIPQEAGEHQWSSLTFGANRFHGDLPEKITTTDWWKIYGFTNFAQDEGGFNIETANLWAPDFTATDIKGVTINPSQIAKHNKLTMVYFWITGNTNPNGIPQELGPLYQKYKKDLSVITICDNGNTEYDKAMSIINSLFSDLYNLLGNYPLLQVHSFPSILMFDETGKMVFHSCVYQNYWDEAKAFIKERLGDGDIYTSSDFSKDKTYETLQTAQKGNGINMVLMGDAFSDRQIADGTYREAMEKACQAFFKEEPYKSFQDYFNVYYVNAVSKNEGYVTGGETVFNVTFGQGTHIEGNDDKCIEYAQVVPGINEMNETLIINVLNSPRYAGTAYLYYNDQCLGDYGQGLGIAYCPAQGFSDMFYSTLAHEAGGHAFAKLGDEYVEENQGIPSEVKAQFEVKCSNYGWYKNNDTESNLSNVKWNRFIRDSRYASENISVYEGAYTYAKGIYRPTLNSMMNENIGGFNAPSREAIYIRIHKLAFGENWQYNYEDFVNWDKQRSITYKDIRSKKPAYPKLHTPIVKERSF